MVGRLSDVNEKCVCVCGGGGGGGGGVHLSGKHS